MLMHFNHVSSDMEENVFKFRVIDDPTFTFKGLQKIFNKPKCQWKYKKNVWKGIFESRGVMAAKTTTFRSLSCKGIIYFLLSIGFPYIQTYKKFSFHIVFILFSYGFPYINQYQ